MEVNKNISFCIEYYKCPNCDKIIYYNLCKEYHNEFELCDECRRK